MVLVRRNPFNAPNFKAVITLQQIYNSTAINYNI